MPTLPLLIAILLSQAEDEPASRDLTPVIQVTAGRHEATIFEAGQAVSVVGQSQLDVATPLIPADLLRGIPGVFVQQTTPGQGLPIIRGLKGSENLHLVDGFRLNNAFFRNAPNQYLALVESSNLDRIEVVRGPASTLYGSDALGGVVHLITREPDYQSGIRMESRMQVASADESITLSAAVEGGSEQRAWRVHAAGQDVGDRRTGDGTVGPSGYESRSFNARYRQKLGSTAEVSVGLQVSQQPETPRVDELVPGFGQTEPDSEVFLFEPNERTFAQAIVRGSTTGWADYYEFHLGFQEIRDDRRTRNSGSTEERRERNTSQLWGVTGQFDRSLPQVDLVYGFEFYDDEVESSRIGRDIETGLTQDRLARFPSGSGIQSTAIYLNAEFDAGARDRLTLGGRYSRFDIDLAQADRASGAQLEPDDVTLNLGWRRELNTAWSLSANLGEGFRAPNIFDLGTLGERPGNRFNVANPNLEPEQLTSLDFGLKWQSDVLQAELFGFTSRFDDKITSVATGQVTPDGRTVVRSENVAEVDLYGLEFGARWYARDNLEAYGSINWTRGRETDADGFRQDADRIPPLNGRLGVIWQAREAVTVEAWTDFADRQDRLSPRDVGDPRINPDGTPGWATVNLRADWQLDHRWRLGASLENLFDRHYREHGSGIDAPGLNAKLLISVEI